MRYLWNRLFFLFLLDLDKSHCRRSSEVYSVYFVFTILGVSGLTFMANKVCYCPLYIRTDIGNDTFHLNKSIFIEYNNNVSKKCKIEFLNIRLPLTVGREESSYFPRILWIGMKLTERQVSTFISQSLLNNSIHVGPSVYPFSTWPFHFAS